MSWFSGFLHAVEDGFRGQPPSKTPSPTTPVHQALIAVDTAANQATQAVSLAAKSTVDDFLNAKIGPVGATMIETSIQALMEELTSRLPSAQVTVIAAEPQPTA